MGDRANVVVLDGEREGKTGVFLYTHWSGSELPVTLKSALQKGASRLDDAPYLARIIFQEMLNGDTGTTGYGISTMLTDNEYPLLVVDCDAKAVTEYPEETYKAHGWKRLATYKAVRFAEYDGKWREG